MKKVTSILMSFVLLFSLSTNVFAQGSGSAETSIAQESGSAEPSIAQESGLVEKKAKEVEAYTPVVTNDTRVAGFFNENSKLQMELAGRHNSGAMNEDGGSLEIVAYNPVNGYAYAVSGTKGTLIAVNLNDPMDGEKVANLSGIEYDVKLLAEGFAYGDMTSVAVSPDGSRLAAVIQAEEYDQKGVVALFACQEDGSLTFLTSATVGVQPDMVTFADNNTILTADEGEPRKGEDGEDPKGSVTILKIEKDNTLTARSLYFDDFDEKRDSLTAAGVLVQKDMAPSTDFEPEYIAVAGKKAYISLQEANAIAVLDLQSETFEGIYPLGFQDYGVTKADLEKNDKIELKNYENVYGIKMPDGISAAVIGGKTYLLTANEGDSRSDWSGYDNEYEKKTSPSGAVALDSKVVWFQADRWDGLDAGKDYVFGGRSFSIYEAQENGLKLVYDSGSDFEEVTASVLPDFFNASNNKTSMDNRSGKKGPEPESVVTGIVDGKTYAYIGLERIGGVMVYDISDPEKAEFVNYINSREFENAVQGDVSPEGLCFVSAKDSKTGNALLLTACEVSGTLAVYECKAKEADHSHQYQWNKDQNSHWKECACGERTEEASHNWEFVTDQEATETEEGIGHESCTVCGYEKEKVTIPVKKTETSVTEKEETKEPSSSQTAVAPKTGDRTKTDVWTTLLVIAGVSLFYVVLYKKWSVDEKKKK